jgi:two-component system OmpR family response regulator
VPLSEVRILLVEDDRATRNLVGESLSEAGYAVTSVERAGEAAAAMRGAAFSAVILDVWLPDGSGVELCREWRGAGLRIPVLMLTARTDVSSRVEGLDAGADDYLGKPFALAELQARLRALLRRRQEAAAERVFQRGRITVDFGRRQAWRGRNEVPLTRREIDVLERLVSARGRAVSRDDLLEEIWGEATPEAESSLEVIVGRLRRKLEASGEPLIRTLRGHGYALAMPGDE